MGHTSQLKEGGRPPDGQDLDISARAEDLWRRQCRGCGWEAPAYLEWCRRCPAVLGDPFPRSIEVFATDRSSGALSPLIQPVAVLALELSGPLGRTQTLRDEANGLLQRLIKGLPSSAAFKGLANGVFAVIFAEESLEEAAEAAARSVTAMTHGGALLRDRPGVERRAGLATGLVDGAAPWQAAVVRRAGQLARAAQPGQALAGYSVVRLLSHEWQFGATGILARRQVDISNDAVGLLGRKRPAPTPSAFASDGGPGLVGRARELAVLDHELAEAEAGSGRWLALVAPAGAGKSKLLRTWLSRLGGPVPRVIGATASAFGQSPRALVDQLLAALGHPLASDADPEHTFAVLVSALEEAARERPLLVVIDDLHWADGPSRAILRTLGPWIPDRCLIVVALRSSFLPSVPWLREQAHLVELPPLTDEERALLLERLVPGDDAQPVRKRILAAEGANGPLYLHQAAAYLAETAADADLPGSLHELVLSRLQHVRAQLDDFVYDRLTAPDLVAMERTIGEWLDRLETEDYEDRMAIAAYLGLLEQIDLSLVVAGSLAGVAQYRNRRLSGIIERFYSAGFTERVDAIEALAEHNPTGAAYAAASGAHHALMATRLDDAVDYLALAVRFEPAGSRGRHLLTLGDLLLARGSHREAFHTYAQARRDATDDATRAPCARRLARALLAPGHWRIPTRLLEEALVHLSGHERLAAVGDLAVARQLGGDGSGAAAMLGLSRNDPDSAPEVESTPIGLRTRLRLGLLADASDLVERGRQAASAVVLSGEAAEDHAILLETTLLLRAACPERIDPRLMSEARRAARRLGNASAETALLAPAGPPWPPLLAHS